MEYLNILIDLCLVFAIARLASRPGIVRERVVQTVERMHSKEILGRLDRVQIDAKIAEKLADRAFCLASSANLGVLAVQKALVVPRPLTKQQVTQNAVARDEVDKLFKADGITEWLKPLMSDEELDILEKAETLQAQKQTELESN